MASGSRRPSLRALLGTTILATGRMVASVVATDQAFVLRNGSVYTMAPSQPYASALCVAGGRIQAVGGDEAVMRSSCAAKVAASAGAASRVVDLAGATVIPGLTDSHAHIMYESARRLRADLLESALPADAVRRASEWARSNPELVKAAGGWVQGFGWDQTKWPGGAFPTRKDLDTMFPDVPVLLEQLSGHACWINSKALEVVAADIPATGDPEGGHIERDTSGKPTGILSDGAMYLVLRHIRPYTVAHVDKALTTVLHECASLGLTGVHDFDALDPDLKLYQQRIARGDLTLRVYAAIRGGAGGGSPDDPFIKTEDGLLTKRTVKFFSDGAMGSWSAAMLKPYNDKPGVSGTLVYTPDTFRSNVTAWAAKGYQIATHAIGDAANRQVLDVYEQLLKERQSNTSDLRWRVEHAQILSAEDLPRFAALGVIPSMQPSHVAADLAYAEARLGEERVSRSYAWRTLLGTGVTALPFGSDFPTAGSIPPLLGIHAAVTRETAEGVPSGGWFPEQRVTREQAIKGYTVDAAFASFREKELGKLQLGFLADLVIFDRDLMTVDAPLLLNATVLGTIVGGHVVYAANASTSAAAAALAGLVPPRARNFHHPREGPKTQAFKKAVGPVASWWRTYTEDAREDGRAEDEDGVEDEFV